MEHKISKTHIEQRMRTKTNSYLVSAIVQLKKTNPEVAKILAMPRKRWPSVNLTQIDNMAKDGEKVFVPGKVLASGDLTKKIKIVSWSASESALVKIKAGKSEFTSLSEEIKTNKDLKGVRILQ